MSDNETNKAQNVLLQIGNNKIINLPINHFSTVYTLRKELINKKKLMVMNNLSIQ